MSEKEFNSKKEKVMNLRNQKEIFKIKEIDSKKVDDQSIFEEEPFLAALAEREEAIANGKKLSILFLRSLLIYFIKNIYKICKPNFYFIESVLLKYFFI